MERCVYLPADASGEFICMVVPEEEVDVYLKHGWYLSPAHFKRDDQGLFIFESAELEEKKEVVEPNAPKKRGRKKKTIEVRETIAATGETIAAIGGMINNELGNSNLDLEGVGDDDHSGPAS